MKSLTSCIRGMRHIQITMIPEIESWISTSIPTSKKKNIELRDETTTIGGRSIKQLVDEFV